MTGRRHVGKWNLVRGRRHQVALGWRLGAREPRLHLERGLEADGNGGGGGGGQSRGAGAVALLESRQTVSGMVAGGRAGRKNPCFFAEQLLVQL